MLLICLMRINEISEEYFEKLMVRKLIACVRLCYAFFMKPKFSFSCVLECMNFRDLFSVGTEVYSDFVKHFYTNKRK